MLINAAISALPAFMITVDKGLVGFALSRRQAAGFGRIYDRTSSSIKREGC
jgi:hypothetical protein